MRKDPLMILFGAWDKPTKALIGGLSQRSPGKAELRICQLKEPIEYGKSIEYDNIEGEYAQLIFCKRESLDVFIETLEKLRELM